MCAVLGNSFTVLNKLMYMLQTLLGLMRILDFVMHGDAARFRPSSPIINMITCIKLVITDNTRFGCSLLACQ